MLMLLHIIIFRFSKIRMKLIIIINICTNLSAKYLFDNFQEKTVDGLNLCGTNFRCFLGGGG